MPGCSRLRRRRCLRPERVRVTGAREAGLGAPTRQRPPAPGAGRALRRRPRRPFPGRGVGGASGVGGARPGRVAVSRGGADRLARVHVAAGGRWACRPAARAFAGCPEGLMSPLSPRLRVPCPKPRRRSPGVEASEAPGGNASVSSGRSRTSLAAGPAGSPGAPGRVGRRSERSPWAEGRAQPPHTCGAPGNLRSRREGHGYVSPGLTPGRPGAGVGRRSREPAGTPTARLRQVGCHTGQRTK